MTIVLATSVNTYRLKRLLKVTGGVIAEMESEMHPGVSCSISHNAFDMGRCLAVLPCGLLVRLDPSAQSTTEAGWSHTAD